MGAYKGLSFKGFSGGAWYDFLASLGAIDAFYRKVAHYMPLQSGMRVLDLGCGTGTFGMAIANKLGTNGMFCGMDISQEQLAHAKEKVGDDERFVFHHGSIDDVPFADGTFDGVVSITTFHHVPSRVRRAAIAETGRVLRDGGHFTLVDLNMPRVVPGGLVGLGLYALGGFDPSLEDHWYNRFPALCKPHGLLLVRDVYMTDFIRLQVFRKEE